MGGERQADVRNFLVSCFRRAFFRQMGTLEDPLMGWGREVGENWHPKQNCVCPLNASRTSLQVQSAFMYLLLKIRTQCIGELRLESMHLLCML